MVGFTDDVPLLLPRRAERLSRHCCMSRVMRCSKGRKSTPSSCTSTHAHNYYLSGPIPTQDICNSLQLHFKRLTDSVDSTGSLVPSCRVLRTTWQGILSGELLCIHP